MHTPQNVVRGDQTAQLIEWQFCDSDIQWEACRQGLPATRVLKPEGALRSAWVARHWRTGTFLLIFLASIGGWTWSVAQRGIAQIEADLQVAIGAESQKRAMQDDSEFPTHFTIAQEDTTRPLGGIVKSWTIVGETAIVQVVTESSADQPALRQTRFYGHTAEGWRRTKPAAEVWGAPSHLESTHFIFHFRQNDASVVAAVAPQIDEMYSDFQYNLGLTPSPGKPVIEVSVEAPTGVMPFPHAVRGHIVVPSPAILLAPVGLSEQEILAQSIALPLIGDEIARAVEAHRIPQHWEPWLRGLRLWQLWELDVPLASWRPEVLQWFYIDLHEATAERDSFLPESYSELCAMHAIWMLSPAAVGIPLNCSTFDTAAWTVMQWRAHVPQMSLDQLRTPLDDWQTQVLDFPSFPDDTLALVTLIEYVVSAYGYEQLPVLLANLSQYNEWETLLPAVFGVSATDFEAGWRSYLAQQYNLSLERQFESSRILSR